MRKFLTIILICSLGNVHAVIVDSLPLSSETPQEFSRDEEIEAQQERVELIANLHQEIELLAEKVELLTQKIELFEKQQREFLGMLSDILVKDESADTHQDQADYQEALQYMKKQQFNAALQAWQKFLDKHPKSDKIPLAYYWIGEIHAIDGNFDLALSSYQFLTQQFPQHSKTAEALLKIGQLYHSKGEKKKAVKNLQLVIDKFPQSSSAQLAKQMILKLSNPSS